VRLATSLWLDSKAPEVPHLLFSREEGEMCSEWCDSTSLSVVGLYAIIMICFWDLSSLYYDEDGDLAHEFYEEMVVTKNGRRKSKLKRIQKNLIPQVCW